MMRLLFALALAFSLLVAVNAAPQAPLSAQEILARSVAAHGGSRVSSWQTMTINGTIEMDDGITYRAAYRVWAKAPDKLKVEQDMTVDRGGRYVYEYFRNGNLSWSRRNLIVGAAPLARLERWTNQCYGVAYYAKQASEVTQKPDATSDWLAKSGTAYTVAERRPAYVVTVTLPSRPDAGGAPYTADLYIDKKTFYLLEEVTPEGRRLYSVFKDFGGTFHPTRILDITKGRNGDAITPITYDTIRYGEPLEDWIFEEDMPRR